MTKRQKKHAQGKTIKLVLVGLVGLGLVIAVLLHGTDVALTKPEGLIASKQLRLMVFTAVVLLGVALPTLFLFYFFAWKYRESNGTASHDPRAQHGKLLVVSIWTIPCVVVLVLASVMWPATHQLAPQKAIAAGIPPLTIEVVAMRWKWLFIYPEQGIASVNFVQVPVNTPLQFELTADETPMSSFWIPHLGGQLYAMTGMVNRLNLMADKPGDYMGRSAEINGAGFAGMQFTTRASSAEDFNQWVQNVRLSPNVLDTASYNKLLSPSQNNPVVLYSQADPTLYDTMLMKYSGSMGMHMEHQ